MYFIIQEIFDSNPSRQWARTFILNDEDFTDGNSTKFVDSFRYFHPNQESAFTCWSTVTGARQTNYGTRIDYIFSSLKFFNQQFIDCVIRPDIEGSDHCPVIATLKSSFINAGKPPPLCTKYMPEFAGKQQKLKAFFKKKEIHTNASTANESFEYTESLSTKDEGKNANKRLGYQLPTSQPKRQKTVSKKCSQGNIFKYCLKTDNKNETMDNQIKVDNRQTQNHEQPLDCQKYSSVKELHQDQTCMQKGSVKSLRTMETSQLSSRCSSNENATSVVAQWKNLLRGPLPAPLCSGHNEPCVLRTVKNNGSNHGKQFYCCARPQGHNSNKEARCKFFKWIKK